VQYQAASDRELAVARELVAAGRKDRALLALKKRQLQARVLRRSTSPVLLQYGLSRLLLCTLWMVG
jgi:hypothetical protein